MAHSARSNPLISRLVTRSSLPPLPRMMWLGTSLGLTLFGYYTLSIVGEFSHASFRDVSLGVTGRVIMQLQVRPPMGLYFLRDLGWLLTLIIPLLAGPLAASITASELSRDLHPLIKLTSVRRGRMFSAYLYTTHHRLSPLIAASMALMPAVVLGTLFEGIGGRYYYRTLNTPLAYDPMMEAIYPAIFLVAIIGGLWGFVTFAATLGAWLALVFKGALVPTLLSVTLTGMTMLAIPVYVLERPPLQPGLPVLLHPDPTPQVLLSLALMIAPHAVSLLFRWIAPRSL